MNNTEREIMDLILDLYPNSMGKISEISIISENYILIKNGDGVSSIYTLKNNELYVLHFSSPENKTHSDKFRQIFRQIKLEKITE